MDREIVADGTRSNFSEQLRRQNLDDYISCGEKPWFQLPEGIDEALAVSCIEEIHRDFGLPCDLRLTTVDDVKYPLGSCAGFGYVGSKGDKFQLAKKKYSGMTATLSSEGFSYLSYPRYVGLSRTQLATISAPKVRLVWCCCFHLLLWQLQLFQGVYAFKKHSPFLPSLFGRTLDESAAKFSQHVGAVRKEAAGDVIFMVTDFASFDLGRSVNDEHINALKNEPASASVFLHGVQPWEILCVAYLLLICYRKTILQRHSRERDFTLFSIAGFIHSAVFRRIQVGSSLYTIIGCMGSGDGYTCFCDSVINALRYKLVTAKLQITRLPYLVGGDDGLFAFHSNLDVFTLDAAILKFFRQRWRKSGDRTAASEPTELVFHGRNWLQTRWSRDLVKTIQLVLYRERGSLMYAPPPFHEAGRVDASISLGRVLALFNDTGSKYSLLLKIAVANRHQWHTLEDTWLRFNGVLVRESDCNVFAIPSDEHLWTRKCLQGSFHGQQLFVCKVDGSLQCCMELHRVMGWRKRSFVAFCLRDLLAGIMGANWLHSGTFHVRVLLFQDAHHDQVTKFLSETPMSFQPFHLSNIVTEVSPVPPAWAGEMKSLAEVLADWHIRPGHWANGSPLALG